MSKQLGPSNHPLEVFRRRLIALEEDGYNADFLRCFRNALETLKQHDALATENATLRERLIEATAIVADYRAALMEVRIILHASGRRPETCHEMSVIDDALRAHQS